MSSGTRPPEADDIIKLLDLAPHPEGGHYRETFRDGPAPGSARGIDCDLFPVAVGRNLPLAQDRYRGGVAIGMPAGRCS